MTPIRWFLSLMWHIWKWSRTFPSQSIHNKNNKPSHTTRCTHIDLGTYAPIYYMPLRVYSIARWQGEWEIGILPTWQPPSWEEVIISHPSPYWFKHFVVFHLLHAACFTSNRTSDSFRRRCWNSLSPKGVFLPISRSLVQFSSGDRWEIW